jgi:beta-galactosidase
MKTIRIGHFLALLMLLASCEPGTTTHQASRARHTVSFNDDWRFSLTADEQAVFPLFDDSSWRSLDLPHDWSIEGSFSETAPAGVGGGALPGGVGWYRKTFNLPEGDSAKRVFIEFDGVYRNSDVWVNGTHVGFRPNGYISFRYDITDEVRFDKPNVISVKVDNSQQPNSRWYSGSGIYRNVRLVTTHPVHVDQYGAFITTPEVSSTEAVVNVETTIRNDDNTDRDISLTTTLYDPAGKRIASETTSGRIAKGHSDRFSQTFKIKGPARWSVEQPLVYSARATVMVSGEASDHHETSFGIRSFSFDAHKGFFLNEQPVKILGVCNHHDLGALGSAVNVKAIERQLRIMKEMGVNAIRTAHNPPAPELLELCDRMGFLVMDEMFDMWKKSKSQYDYSLYWDEWHKKDLEEFIKRDRNHPSVVVWSIGNEILEQWDSTGVQVTRELAGIVRALDNTRPVATGNNEIVNNHLIRSGAMDLIGYNYNHKEFDNFHKQYPEMKFIGTETTSALATRGHYDMPSDSIRRWPIRWDQLFTEGNADNTVSAYDHVSAPWGSTHEETWKIVKKHAHLSGMFIWTGFDYLGEPTPYRWPSRSSYFGVVDLAGFPKDSYYMYKSEWTSDPVLHVFPHWTWAAGQTIDVWAYYNNADEVELFVNGVSKGVRQKNHDDLHVMWRLVFEPGTLRAVSRRNGREVLVREIRTAGLPATLSLESDRRVMAADGSDLTFVTVSVLDADGNVVPWASNEISFQVNGQGSLAGVDNGDPTSHTSFRADRMKAFSGLCLAIVRAGKDKGSVTLTVSSDGLKSASVKIDVK